MPFFLLSFQKHAMLRSDLSWSVPGKGLFGPCSLRDLNYCSGANAELLEAIDPGVTPFSLLHYYFARVPTMNLKVIIFWSPFWCLTSSSLESGFPSTRSQFGTEH
jgi:hypothetical protein